jgi:cyclic beta-1,2-glucan synthetase
MVVVPTLLSGPSSVDEAIERLEIHYLSNASDDLTLALLSDWNDAPSETLPTDEPILRRAAEGIARLNRSHPRADGDRFLLLHRKRLWSETQDCWLGWERKRGKLQELNRLLRGATDTTFMAIGGVAPKVPDNVRFVITLDSDSRLPRDAVRRLVGKMAHVINQPRFDPARKLVVEGYGILQPRVTLALPHGSEGSWFQRVFSGARGMDPYASPVSDVYQDLFGEGTFLGKGIYDVDAFEASMEGRSPENAILSHDLFEGIFARAGLAGDVEVVEAFPRRYDVATSRQHRWARGDWQLLGWLVERKRLPGMGGPATLLGRWKMLDNLRRTLSAPVTVVALFLGWLLPPAACLIWTAFVLVALAAPAILPVILGAFHVSPRSTWRLHFASVGSELGVAVAQTGFVIATLVHQAALMTDAIVRTLWRLAVSRKRLLEWTTAEQAAQKAEMGLAGFFRWMWTSPLLGLAALFVAFAHGDATGLVAVPFALAWLAAPAIAWRASRVRPNPAMAALRPDEAKDLRLIARRTWRFFETFVTAEHNWLPPDNFQEGPPQAAVASRTSPTNMGLYLLAVAAAHDFGWLGLSDSIGRLEATFATLRKMFRFRGHFYNWYDTLDLRPLDPQYVSSVDSGNFAGHLLALANACDEIARSSQPSIRRLEGIDDSIVLARHSLAERKEPDATTSAALDRLTAALRQVTRGDANLATLQPLAEAAVQAARARAPAPDAEDPVVIWAEAALAAVVSHVHDAPANDPGIAERLGALSHLAREMATQMDFRFLMDPDRQLMSIGYVTSESRRDSNCYDLLASEARLASFFAIAKGEVPTKHWFRLGRATTLVEGGAALVSWSGSMFEYLMPSLVMRAPFGSLLESTNRLIVRRQISYGAAIGTPWGISESAYNARDFEFTYQYLNFGVPGLGLKRGLSASRVIAPYATALAAMVDPGAAAKNYKALEAAGGRGHFGFYEALDFTPGRVPEGATVAVVRTYMAHHQGMTILAIANVLLDGVMRRRFHSEPGIAASELLLEERHPQVASAIPVRADELVASAEIRPAVNAPPRQFETAHTARPQSGVLSNTRYSVMVTNSGSGYSHWKNLAVTRWREDASLDDWGSYIYLRDLQDRRVWSAGYQPTCVEPESYSTSFAEDRIRITRRDRTIMTTLEIAVSAEDDAEVRRVSLTNMGGMERQIEVTSFAEMVLGPDADDVAHPAFAKMFVETEFVKEHGTLIGRRRKRDPGEPDVWAGHFAVVEGQAVGELEVETDRARFIGVGQTLRSPAAMQGEPLSNSVGTVLDPIFSLRRRIVVPPGTTARVSFWTLVGPSRESILDQVIKYDDAAAFERVGTLAWTHAQVQLRHIDLTSAEASIFQRLGTCILFPEPRFRAPEEVLKNPAFELRGLWAQGISADLPIVVLRLDSVEDIALARELALAHEYLRLKRLPFDLVIVNERGSSYAQDLQQSLEVLGRASETRLHLADEGRAGRIFLLRNDLLSAESRLAIMLAARVILVGSRGTLSGQLDRFAGGSATVPAPRRARRPSASRASKIDLEFANEFGGFVDLAREYAITIEGDQRPPAPWINVVANPSFGFHVAADGASYTWSVNSRDNQITPWSNDPVVNRSGETLYIRDDESGELWGPTAHPWQNQAGSYRAFHGRGYSRFEHAAAEIASELTSFVPLDDSLKIMRLKLRNLSARPRRLSVAAYMEWVLATSRAQSAASIVTEMSPGGTLMARNPRNQAYPHRLAFLGLRRGEATWTGDRSEFLGRHGSTADPAALVAGGALSNRIGAGLDPCGALLTQVALAPGEEREVTIFLGDAVAVGDADALIEKYRSANLDAVFAAVKSHWDEVLGAVTVATPDRSMDLMLNGWLLYQTLACRMWARSGFYQASGAFGFRDQLQDCLALVFAAPNLAREHILRAAARQFVEGDLQHWWLPASGQGVRTRIADDPVWLAYAVAEYVSATGDTAILDETVPYLEGPRLAEHEHDAFFAPEVSGKTASVYQHCVEALQQSAAIGERGLPLMRGGDWNDGMNRVGIGGKGESVWLAWFRYRTLLDFAAIA